MIWPQLIPTNACNTPVHVQVYSGGTDEDGAPIAALEIDAMCNYQSSGKTALTADKREVQLSGVCLFRGDIVPELPELTSGKVTVAGMSYQLFKGTKARNPDGTVNYTRLELV